MTARRKLNARVSQRIGFTHKRTTSWRDEARSFDADVTSAALTWAWCLPFGTIVKDSSHVRIDCQAGSSANALTSQDERMVDPTVGLPARQTSGNRGHPRVCE